MNLKRFAARTSREALTLVRQALGDDAVVLSTKPSGEGVEVLAMAPEGMRQIEKLAPSVPTFAAAAPAAAPATAPARSLTARSAAQIEAARPEPAVNHHGVADDVAKLAMSTLSFQDYVRERMLKRRAEAKAQAAAEAAPAAPARAEPPARPAASRAAAEAGALEQRMAAAARPAAQRPLLREPPVLHDAVRMAPAPTAQDIHVPSFADGMAGTAKRDQDDMMSELRAMKGLIEERFGALAFMEKLQRQPGQARLTQKLLDCGFSPALIRKLCDALPNDVADEGAWAGSVLERNLCTAEAEAALEDRGGVYALVGATGVGKTTTTAKIAAAFATKYGAANLGLITLDAYRIGAHEQLRAYGRILGVPVHTAHDRASLEDLLELLSAKKMVLIDTAGMAQRDTRTRELLEMLSHRSIQKLLVINAASQGETIEDVLAAYRGASCRGVVLSKMDEAVKLGPAIDALIRHKLKVIGVANGQRVPEDWHRLGAQALVQRALRGGGSSAYRLDASDVNLVFAAPQAASARGTALHA
ncbi:MAG: flagellar biosynthesis protein FlhF [Proteobacteria bacterium]|nr:flagellar biosynthesis protein FlhF [Pseudomonadota bacterium]